MGKSKCTIGADMARRVNDVTRNRIRLNAGRYSAAELARVIGSSVTSVEKMAQRMGLSLRVRKVGEGRGSN